MNAQEKALRDAFLAEMWKPCRELPYGERMAKRVADEMAREISTGPVHNPAETVDEGAARSA